MCLRLQRYSYTHRLCMWDLATERQKFDVWQKSDSCVTRVPAPVRCNAFGLFFFIHSFTQFRVLSSRQNGHASESILIRTLLYIYFFKYMNRIKCCNYIEFFVVEHVSESSFHVEINCESNYFESMPNRFRSFFAIFFSLELIFCNHAHIVYSNINELLCCAIGNADRDATLWAYWSDHTTRLQTITVWYHQYHCLDCSILLLFGERR